MLNKSIIRRLWVGVSESALLASLKIKQYLKKSWFFKFNRKPFSAIPYNDIIACYFSFCIGRQKDK